MVASVKQTKDNPFFSQFIEDDKGFLVPFVERRVNRRQDCPSVFNYNGAIYIFRSNRINNARLHELDRVRGYVMDEVSSIDIDTKFDWMVAEAAIDSGLFITTRKPGGLYQGRTRDKSNKPKNRTTRQTEEENDFVGLTEKGMDFLN